ncbi:MAG: NosD domain-containing protein [Candidatus Methanoperedens sp.]
MAYNKIIIGICLIILNIGFASAATLNVGQGQTYATIQSAIDAAQTGDIISVAEGTYSENLVVKTNGISIIGKNKEKTIIDGKKTGSVIKIDQANNIKVSGFTVQNSGGSGQSDAGISLYRANNNFIANVNLVNNVMGISIYEGSSNNIISGNDIKSSGKYGIFIVSSSDNKIYNNNIQNNKIGIYCDSARSNHIYSNNLIDNNDQAYDNSGLNSWDDGKSGNYWSVNKGILGGKNTKDNYPLSRAVTIKYEDVPAPTDQKAKGAAPEETGKPSPGFAGFAVLVSLIVIGILSKKK